MIDPRRLTEKEMESLIRMVYAERELTNAL